MDNSVDFRLTDARLILGKWCAEETPLLCLAELSNFAVSLLGTISSITDDQFVFAPSSGDAKLTFRLDDPGLLFVYAERRELPDAKDLDEASASRPILAIVLPARIPMRLPLPDVPPERETLKFIER